MLLALLLRYSAAAIVLLPVEAEGGCGGTFVADQGVVKSPRYPKKYPHNSNCVYNILASSDATLKLTCTKMNIQKSVGCTKDSLRINGVSFCGKNPPRNIFAKGQIRLELVTDGSKNKRRGFRCLYERVEGDAYSPESCDSRLSEKSSWNAGWNGQVNIPVDSEIASWTVDFEFTSPVTSFEQWTGVTTAISSTRLSVSKANGPMSAGQTLSFEILYRFAEQTPVPTIKLILLNGKNVCTDEAITTTTPQPTEVTTLTEAPYTGPGCALEGSSYNYDEVLHKSLLFYEAQRSGYLPSSQRVTWRKDSATDDAIDDDTQQRVDLEGGYYDAGDYVKFGYPMAGMTTVLAWGAIEYGEAYTAAGEMAYMKEAVKWSSDYFIKAHPEANVFYGQVGDGDVDHAYWGRPEDMTMYRPAFKLTTSKPGSDLAGETAAALAATSILFKDSDPSYAATCLQHAEELYNFANQYQGKYAQSITDAASFYNSWGVFDDELAWAAAWLYRATNNRDYLSDAKSHYNKLSKSVSEFSWAEKTPGVQVLLSEYADEADKSTYVSDLTSFCDKMVYSMPRTPKRLVFINEWGSLRYAANVAFICLRAADLGISPSIYRQFGKEQIHYMLGDTGRSFVVGFGHNPPLRPHHASSSCPLAPAPCGWSDYSSAEPNVHELTGALVGGPDASDNYVDRRDDYKSNEVTTDYNAGFQSAVAALRVLADCGNSTGTTVYTSTIPESTNPGETTGSESTHPETIVPTTQQPTVVTSEGTVSPTSANPNETTDSQSTTQETLVPTTSVPTVVTTEGTSSCESILQVSSSWNTGWNGKVNIPISTAMTSWTVEFVFTSPVTSFEQWTGTTTAHSDTRFSVAKDNAQLPSGSVLSFDFLYRYNEGSVIPSIQSIKLNGQDICHGQDPLISTEAPVTVTTVTEAPYTGPGCALEGSSYNYDEVLHKSLLFYEAQRSGYLPSSQRVTWRKDSATDDAIDDDTQQRVDLEGGYYDAGDYVKFGYPMAGMTTVLAWGAIEYGEAYTEAGEMAYMKEAVKWSSDYFIKAHPEANVFYGQVGDGDVDHAYWGRPEDMTMYRPAFKLTTSKPGSDLAGETAAALAATSILFKDSDPSYAATCLQHAEDLYSFANQYQGKYAQSITDAATFYNSWGVFDDELAWAAVWLYRATNNRDYLSDAKSHYNKLSKSVSEFSWAEKTPGVQVLLSEYADEADKSTYVSDLKSFCDKMVYSMPRTPKRLVFINEWGSLRYAANVAFICLRAADLGISPSIYRQFGKEQIHYMLGDTGRSFVVGFGHNPPLRPHHASSSCPLAPAPCGWSDYSSAEPNVHELTGALVGGPDASDNYVDRRDDYKSNEVTTDYNAGFQSAVAALRVLANCGNNTGTTVYTPTIPGSTNPGETTGSESTNPETVVPTTQQPTVVTSESTLSPTSANPETTESTNPSETTDIRSTNPVTVVPTTQEPTLVTTGGISSCESLLQVTSSWNDGWNGKVNIPVSSAVTSWTVEFEFTAPLTSFEQWTGTTTWLSDTRFSVTKDNTQLSSGSILSFDILYRFIEGPVVPAIASMKFNGETICIRETATTTLPAGGYACTSVELLNEWTGNYQMDVSVTFPATVSSWAIVLTFSDTVDHVEAYTAIETTSGNTATLVNESYNGQQTAGQTLVLGMQVSYSSFNKPLVTAVEMNGMELCIE
ncbi:uncharacterized protein [Macrobrachium rosenbergii]|uniref:uncharacterized protein n=1 Tax=Macrobrachium rosenbergii TaxID=79674 RepID=UPI0034D4F4FF